MSTTKIITSLLIANFALSVLPVLAQSLDVKNPAPLQEGINQGAVDSMVGPHYWYFFAEPGSFSGTVTKGGSPGETIKATLGAGVAFAPKLKGSVVTTKDKGNVTNFSGSVQQRNRVVVMIDPGRAGLVRSAATYQIRASGNVSFGAVSSKPAISGTYMAMVNNYGLTKFQDDGKVVCASGVEGKWTLFDADTKTYVVTIDRDKRSLKLVPGRGLTDAADTDLVIFTQMH